MRPLPIVRYAYYAFIFSIPIETLDIGINTGMFSLSKLTGLIFFAIALLQPQICFKSPPRAFWYFLAYILICFCLGMLFETSNMIGQVTIRLFTLLMLVILFWVSYNLLQDDAMVKGAFLTLVGSCMVLVFLMVSGKAMAQGRVTALAQNANALGATLSLGLLALLGLAYGRNDFQGKIRLIVWMCFGSLAVGIVMTGSRTPILGLLAGMIFLVAKRGNVNLRLQVGFFAVLVIGVLIWASYENDAVRLRWERAFMQGDLARREAILPEAWNMFTEKPLVGWGPVSNCLELGSRFGEPSLDTHNVYLWVLTETGILGSTPFFIGLWLCWRAAWRATRGHEGSLPAALLTCLLILNMAGSLHNRKLFWIVLAYGLASDACLLKQWRMTYTTASSTKAYLQPV